MAKWRAMVGWEGCYEISDKGQVRTVPRWVKNSSSGAGFMLRKRILVTALNKGRPFVVACKLPRRENVFIHRAVAAAFLGPCPEGMEVLHGDGDPLNNSIRNLRYGTRVENMADARRHGTLARGEAHGRTKLSEANVRQIRVLAGKEWSQNKLAAAFGVSQGTIYNILHKKTWGWLA